MLKQEYFDNMCPVFTKHASAKSRSKYKEVIGEIVSSPCRGAIKQINRADFRFAPSQWETALLCNDVSHWLGASLESALITSMWPSDSIWWHGSGSTKVQVMASCLSAPTAPSHYLDQCQLEQQERLRSEDTPRRLMITHTIESYWIPSQKKTKSKLQI